MASCLAIPERQYFGQRQRWSDGKRQRLEDHLSDFVAALIASAEQQRLHRGREGAERRIAAEPEREAGAPQHAARAVLARDLHRRMSAWRAAQDTRAFDEIDVALFPYRRKSDDPDDTPA